MKITKDLFIETKIMNWMLTPASLVAHIVHWGIINSYEIMLIILHQEQLLMTSRMELACSVTTLRRQKEWDNLSNISWYYSSIQVYWFLWTIWRFLDINLMFRKKYFARSMYLRWRDFIERTRERRLAEMAEIEVYN